MEKSEFVDQLVDAIEAASDAYRKDDQVYAVSVVRHHGNVHVQMSDESSYLLTVKQTHRRLPKHMIT